MKRYLDASRTAEIEVEEVTIEPDEELRCDYCGKPADADDLWQDGNPIECNSAQCKQRRRKLTIDLFQRASHPRR